MRTRPGPSRILVSIAIVFLALAAVSTAQRTRPAPTRPSRPAPPPAKTERPVPFAVGETLRYAVSWSSYLTAGTATLTVREKKVSYGSTAYYLVAEGQSTGIVGALYPAYYKDDTLVDVYTLLPQRASLYAREGSTEETKLTTFDRPARTARFELRGQLPALRNIPIAPDTQDALSALFLVRTMAMNTGSRVAIPVTDNGQSYRVEVTVNGRESVRVGAGTMTAWRLTPVITNAAGDNAAPRGMSLWLSDDARRIPVKMRAQLPVGSFDLTLTGRQ